MNSIPEMFGSMVFNTKVMRERLPEETYAELQKTIKDGEPLSSDVANVVANAMKEWAVEKGATHYTHWFQPMTGVTAEKHDSFIEPAEDDSVIMEFSGKALIKGESDASSFPSRGIRATFEARGYTVWDPTSYAFIKDGTLCIPTAFCSYSGEVLDKKTPLLRSVELLNKQAMRILNVLGNTEAHRVITTVGAEQEYFLVDKKYYDKRKDLIFAGRTLFGTPAPKGQELEDHYYGNIKPRVSAYMKELDEELWKLGVLAKTKHNEAAPAQHEMAPIYTTANIATDHNQLTMEVMKKLALKHGLVCLLHEKPFAGVNGSGKHNNWSLTTDTGENLLNPTKRPYENTRFLVFLAAVIKAVDKYQDLLRASVASAGNDCRLGGFEAPPAIVSLYVGDELEGVLDAIEKGVTYEQHTAARFESGVDVLPNFRKDTTDRNRTSPFAFTGNKFEFRMVGSSFSNSDSNIVLNTIVAEALDDMATELEKLDVCDEAAVRALIRETYVAHKRIVFNGNNYSEEWVQEAEKRGLLNLKTTPDALPAFVAEKNIALFEKYGIFTETEMRSRCESMLENYSNVRHIEAMTMLIMARKDIMPAAVLYMHELAETQKAKADIGIATEQDAELILAKKLSALIRELHENTEALDAAVAEVMKIDDGAAQAPAYKDIVLPCMDALRKTADTIQSMTGSKYWPYPTYDDLMFGV